MILLLVGGVAVAAGYFGLVPSLAKVLGTSKARDLGIRCSNINIVKLNARLGSQVILVKSGNSGGPDFTLEGQKSVKYSLTGEEISALANSPLKFYPFQEVQIKINPDGTLETSEIIRTNNIVNFAKSLGYNSEEVQKAINNYKIPISEVPIYAKGTLTITNNKPVLNLSSLVIGRIGVSASIVQEVSPTLESAVESILTNLPGVYVNSMTFDQGKMNFVGTIPTKQTILTD